MVSFCLSRFSLQTFIFSSASWMGASIAASLLFLVLMEASCSIRLLRSSSLCFLLSANVSIRSLAVFMFLKSSLAASHSDRKSESLIAAISSSCFVTSFSAKPNASFASRTLSSMVFKAGNSSSLSVRFWLSISFVFFTMALRPSLMLSSRLTMVCAFSYTEAFSFSLSRITSMALISSDKLAISCSANIRPPRMTAYSFAKPSSSFSFLLIIFEASTVPVIHARASMVEFHSLTSVSFCLKASPSITATASRSRSVASVTSLDKRLSVSIQSCLSLSFFCASLNSFC